MGIFDQIREVFFRVSLSTLDRAIEARMKGVVAVTREAAELLAQRGLMPVPGGYTWRSDSRWR